jgi:hypothetical protein
MTGVAMSSATAKRLGDCYFAVWNGHGVAPTVDRGYRHPLKAVAADLTGSEDGLCPQSRRVLRKSLTL